MTRTTRRRAPHPPTRHLRRVAALGATIALATIGVVLPVDAGAATPTWTIVSDLPPSYTYFGSLSCASASDCAAVASTLYGTTNVVGTTDGGAQWTTLYATPVGTFSAQVIDLSATDLVVLTSGLSSATLLHSTDGGATWSSNPVPETSLEALLGEGLWCSSATTCALTTQPSEHELDELSTTSGGATWTEEAAPVPGFAYGLTCVARSECFTTVLTGGGRLYRTIDAGARWSPMNAVPEGPIQVACTTLHRCVATSSGGSRGSVWTSTSAGNHWAEVEQGSGWVALALGCNRGAVCTAFWAPTGTEVAPRLGVSPDGGATWQRTEDTTTAGSVADASCGSTSTCLLATTTLGGPDGPTWMLYATADGGSTWSSELAASGPVSLDDVACPSATSCLLVGEGQSGATVETSSDGGSTWATTASPTGAGEGLGSLSCLSASNCLAISTTSSGTALVRTTDLGATWAQVPLASNVNDVECVSATTCFVSAGTLTYVSKDGGVTWSLVTMPAALAAYPVSVIGVACRTTTSCFAVATYQQLPIILSSSNGGTSWSISHEIKGSDFWFGDQMTCPTASRCLSIADASNIFQTGGHEVPLEYTYDGSSWSPRYEFGEEILDLAGVQCQASGTCEAAANLLTGAPALELTSTDFGQTWTPSSMPLELVSTMTCSSSSSCVAVGLDAQGGWAIAQLS